MFEPLESRIVLSHGAVVFSDNFESGSLSSSKWSVRDATVESDTNSSSGPISANGTYAVELDGNSTELRTISMDLRQYDEVTLSYYVEAQGREDRPESSDDLLVEYWTGSEWKKLKQHDISQVTTTSFVKYELDVPSDGINRYSTFRWNASASDYSSKGCGHFGLSSCVSDDWYIDTVSVLANRKPRITLSHNLNSDHGTVYKDSSTISRFVSWDTYDPDPSGHLLSVSAKLFRNGKEIDSSTDAEGSFSVRASREGLGAYQVVVTAEDNGGLKATDDVDFSFVDDDTKGPTIKITDPNPIDGFANFFRIEINDPSEIALHNYNVKRGTESVGSLSDSRRLRSVNRTFSLDSLGVGTFEITVNALDSDNDRANDQIWTKNVKSTVTIIDDDDTPPVVIIGGSEGEESHGETQFFEWEATDADSGIGSVDVTIRRNGTVIEQFDTAEGEFNFDSYGVGTFEITVVAVDADDDWDGDASDRTVTQEVTVTNDPPVVNPLLAGSASEGAPFDLSATFSDVDGLSGHTATVAWGDGTTTSATVAGGLITASHTYANNGTYPATVTVRDQFNASSSASVTNTVVNEAPQIIALGDFSGEKGEAITLQADVFDPGSNDVLTYEWDFGDGQDASGVDLNSVQHTYSTEGEYHARLTVRDDSNDSTFSDFRVVVGPPVNFLVDQLSVNEAVGTVTVSAEFAIVATEQIEIPLLFSGTAVNGEDYSLASPVLVIDAGETTGSVEVAINDDVLNEDLEQLVISMGVPSNASLGAANQVIIDIVDNDPLPQVAFTTASQTTSEFLGSATVAARLSELSGRDVVIPLSYSGTASDGDDYNPADQIVIPAGELTGTATVQVINDILAEGAELIVVEMLPSAQAAFSTAIGAPLVHSIQIPANDAPSVTFTSAGRDVPENIGTVTVTAELSNPSTKSVEVPFSLQKPPSNFFFRPPAASNPEDYFIAAGSPIDVITIPPGSLTGSLTLEIVNDSVAEKDEKFRVVMGTPVNATRGATTSSTIKIEDNDTPKVFFTQSKQSLFEDGGSVTIDVTMTNVSSQNVTIPLSYSGWATKSCGLFNFFGNCQVDYTDAPSSISIAAGELSTSFTIDIENDDSNEGAESFYISMDEPSGADIAGDGTHTIVILDDDPYVSFSTTKSSSLSEGAGAFTRSVSLSAPTNKDVIVPFTLEGAAELGADYTIPTPYEFFIPAGSYVGTISGTIIDDNFEDNPATSPLDGLFTSLHEQIRIKLGTPTNATLKEADGGFFNFDFLSGPSSSDTEHVIQIIDNDLLPGVSLYSEGTTKVKEGSRTTIRAELDATVPVDVVITIGAASGSAKPGVDYRLSSNTIRIPAGEFKGTTDVIIIDDSDREPDEELGLRITDLKNAKLNSGFVGPADSVDYVIPANDVPVTVKPRPKVPVPLVGTLAISADTVTETLAAPPLGTPVVSGPVATLPPGTGFLAIVVDGYIEGSTAFFDANKNGVLDFLDLDGNGQQGDGEPQEVSTLTAKDGSFQLTIPSTFDVNGDGVIGIEEGQLVVVGGIDTSTLLPLPIKLVAPVGFYAASPITTVMAGLINEHGIGLDGSQNRALGAFDLPSVDLRTLNIIAEADRGNVDAAGVFAVNAQIQDTVLQVASLIGSLTGAPPLAFLADLTFANMAAKIVESGSKLDLGDSGSVESVIQGVLDATGLTLPADSIEAAATVIAANNLRIQLVPLSDESFLTEVARHQQVAQDYTSDQLRQLGAGEIDVDTFIANNTGDSLETRLAAAELGDVVPPALSIFDVVEVESDGDKVFEFTVLIDRASVNPVSVDFSTVDESATTAVGDYQDTSGTLHWEAGDATPKTIQVTVSGDTTFEGDERFRVLLSDPLNAVLRQDLGYGFVLNDDALIYDAPTGGTENLLGLNLDLTRVTLIANDELVVDASVQNPAPILVRGAADVPNSLFVLRNNDSNLLDAGMSFVGGDEADQLTIVNEQATLAIRTMTSPGNGTFEVDGDLISYQDVETATDSLTATITGIPQQSVEGTVITLGSKLPTSDEGQNVERLWRVTRGNDEIAVGSDEEMTFTPDDNGEYLVTLTLTGEGRGTGVTTTVIGVENLDPLFDLGAGETLLPPLAGSFHRGPLSFTDPGNDTWTATVNYGDGSDDQPLALQPSKEFQLQHVYGDSGRYTVSVTISDEDGGSTTRTIALVVILNTPPRAIDDAIATTEDTSTTFSVLADNGFGADEDDENNIVPAKTIALTSPALGQLTNHNDGTFTYDPLDAFQTLAVGTQDTQTFTYQIEDLFEETSAATVTITIAGINDAPHLDPTGQMRLGNIREDQVDNPGNTVAEIIASAGGDRITDVDQGALEGVAVVSGDVTHGFWQYSIDDGQTWQGTGPLSLTEALLLRSQDRLRFVPNLHYSGPAGNIEFRAWDQTDGNLAGATGVDASNGGTTSAYSQQITTTTLNVIPVADLPTLSTNPTQGTENDPVPLAIQSTLVDDDGSESLAIEIRGMPGGAILNQGLNQGSGVWKLQPADLAGLTVTTPDNQSFDLEIVVTATEAANNDSAANTATLSVVVANSPPTVVVNSDQSVVEGATLELIDIATFTDPGFEDTPAGTDETFQATIDWGDGTPAEAGTLTIDAPGKFGSPTKGSVDGSHTYADNGTYVVRVTVTDDDGDSATQTFETTVTNAAPVVSLSGSSLNLDDQGNVIPFSGVVGQTLYFDGTFRDPGFDNPHNPHGPSTETFDYRIVWGDNTAPASGRASVDTPGKRGQDTEGSFSASHKYPLPGVYTVTAIVTDDDGDTGRVVELATIQIVALQPGVGSSVDLAVGGTTGDDTIQFDLKKESKKQARAVELTYNDQFLGAFPATGRLFAFGQAGDDEINASGSTTLAAWFYGDEGDDRLNGGAGNDVLLGGPGDDHLSGRLGRDLLIGGRGSDRILGQGGDDILIGGFTAYDYLADQTFHRDHRAALEGIMAEWTSDRDHQTRVAHLNGSPGGDNGPYSLSYQLGTVHDDDDKDMLTGSAGDDWFFFQKNKDKATDIKDKLFGDDLGFLLD